MENITCEGVLRKSTKSGNTNCVTARPCVCHGPAVGDSKDPDGPLLSFSGPAWRSFVGALQADKIAA